MELGVQLYGAMALLRENPGTFFERLRAAGYTQAEPCIAFGMTREEIAQRGLNPVWLPEETAEFCVLAKQAGLSVRIAHIFGDPLEHRAALLKTASENGFTAYVIGCPACTGDAEFERFTARCREAAASLQAGGVALWMHNGYREIAAKRGDKTVYEAVLEACGGAVGAEPDVGWVQFGGEDPVPLLRRIRPYLRAIHYKDIRGTASDVPEAQHYCCLGDGLLDIEAVRAFASTTDALQLIDQDASDGDFLHDLERSAEIVLGKA